MNVTDVGEVEEKRMDLADQVPRPGAIYQGLARRLHRGDQILAFISRRSHPECMPPRATRCRLPTRVGKTNEQRTRYGAAYRKYANCLVA